jgi:hypothetical protein
MNALLIIRRGGKEFKKKKVKTFTYYKYLVLCIGIRYSYKRSLASTVPQLCVSGSRKTILTELEMTMAQWFEDLTKIIADEKMGRRSAIRHVAGTIAGIVGASAIPNIALARQTEKCTCGNSCSGECGNGGNCPGNPNPNCYCFIQLGGGFACGCNSYCSQTPTCANSSQCKKGFVCITFNGCTSCQGYTGVCVARCRGKHKNCQLGSGHGTTAAGPML